MRKYIIASVIFASVAPSHCPAATTIGAISKCTNCENMSASLTGGGTGNCFSRGPGCCPPCNIITIDPIDPVDPSTPTDNCPSECPTFTWSTPDRNHIVRKCNVSKPTECVIGCAVGYWYLEHQPQVPISEVGCYKCPENMTSDLGAAKSVNECYFAPGTSIEDDTGYFTIKQRITYSEWIRETCE